MEKIFKFFLDLFFPKFCLGCKKEGTFLCEDCFSVIEFAKEPLHFKDNILEKVYFVGEYQNPILKKFIRSLKYPPFLSDLEEELEKIFKTYFSLISFNFSDYILIPVPLEKKRKNWRGFNQSEKIAKVISKILKFPIFNDIIERKKNTIPQVFLTEKERKENIKGAFSVKNREKIEGKNFFIVDDVFTTGATLREIASILKKNGAKKVSGIVLAVGRVEDDLREN